MFDAYLQNLHILVQFLVENWFIKLVPFSLFIFASYLKTVLFCYCLTYTKKSIYIRKYHYLIEVKHYDFDVVEKLQINSLSTDANEQIIANDLLRNVIANASIFDYLNKTVGNRSITEQILESTKATTGICSYEEVFLTISSPENQSCSEYILVLLVSLYWLVPAVLMRNWNFCWETDLFCRAAL